MSLRTQDRAALLEPLRLPPGVSRSAKIDEIKIHAFDFGSAQIRSAKIRLADFLDRLVLAIFEIIGVKPGSSSLTGNDASHQARSRRAGMERSAGEIGAAKVGPRPFHVGQAGLHQYRLVEAGSRCRRTREQTPAKNCPHKLCSREIVAFEIAFHHGGSAKRCMHENGGAEVVMKEM